MKQTKSKFIYKVFALVCALVFVFLFMPTMELTALARTIAGTEYTDYSYLQIGRVGSAVSPKKSVDAGRDYDILMAYIGGNNSFGIGRMANDTVLSSGVQLKDSSVKVYYGGVEVEIPAGNINVTGDYYGSFTAEKTGTYTITYAYSYYYTSDVNTVYTNFYDFNVESNVNTASIDLTGNQANFLPKVIDLSLYKKVDGKYKNITLPLPKITDHDGNEVDYTVHVNDYRLSQADYATGDHVILSGSAGSKSLTAATSTDTKYLDVADGSAFIAGDALENFNNNVEYSIKYAYYHNGEFIKSETLKTTVYNEYYTNYTADNLVIETAEALTTSAQPGIEQNIPAVVVKTNSKATPSAEAIDVYYKVSVKYMATGASTWTDIKDIAEYADVVDANGYLKDETKFTPLEPGTYSINYTVSDFYGTPIETTKDGRYSFEKIVDGTNPTPIIYDASVTTGTGADKKPTYEDARYQMQSYSYANGVVVYAISADDNYSKKDKMDLKRIVKLDSDELFTIEGYDAYNLVFNYNKSTSNSIVTPAFVNLYTNNFALRQKIDAEYAFNDGSANGYADNAINSDADMLKWLIDNGYRIVIDNGNVNAIQEIFATEIAAIDSSITDGDKLAAYLKTSSETDGKADATKAKTLEATLSAKGFAYVNSSKTFGAKSDANGYGLNTFTVQYWAYDEAGNNEFTPVTMEIATGKDDVAPEISFATTFENTYLTTDKITFAKPTASDNEDASMFVETYYRFVGAANAPITTVKTKDNEELDATFDATSIINYLVSSRASQSLTHDENGVAFTTKYAAYNGAGYIRLTDKSATSYEIDLNDFNLTTLGAKGVQILVYTYDDAGNIQILVKNFGISTAIDTTSPTLRSIEFKNEEEAALEVEHTYIQGSKITLPTITVVDDLVNYVNFDINVYYMNGSERQNLSGVAGAKQSYNVRNYTYTLDAGTFVAPFKGEYLVSIALTDSADNSIVVFLHYTAKSVFVVQDPTISVSISEDTLQLDNQPEIKLPTPRVNYTIDDSIDYESYSAVESWTGSQKPQYVVIGADADGYATDYTTTLGNEASFKPTKVGNYDIVYTVNLTVYDANILEYFEGTYADLQTGSFAGHAINYFYFNTDATNRDIRIQKVDETENQYVIYYKNGSSFESTIVTIEDGAVVKTLPTTLSTLLGRELAKTANKDVKNINDLLTNYLVSYKLKSNAYAIVVKDTLGPTIKSYDYQNSISEDEIKKTGGASLKVYGIEATDANGINLSRSSVTVTTTYIDNGKTRTTSSSLNAEEKLNGKTVSCTRNGTVTITYTVYDNAGNSNSASYTINAGDNTKPVITYKTGKEESSVIEKASFTLKEIKNGLVFNVENLQFTDASGIQKVEYVLTDAEGNEVKLAVDSDEANMEAKKLTYDVESVGNYTLTVTVTDNNGNYDSKEFKVEVKQDEVNTDLVYQIVGIVLIVISVLLLAGVIIYFVISKVKLDKELKKSM